MKKTVIQISGLHCPSCKTLIESVSSEMPGVYSAVVDSRSGEAVIEHDEGLNLNTLKKEIESLGDYKVEI